MALFDDLYPVTVEAGDRRYRKARVAHRDGQVRLLIDGGKAVKVAEQGVILDAHRHPGRRWVLDVDTGGTVEQWDVRRAGGCGCGSRLKRYTTEQVWS